MHFRWDHFSTSQSYNYCACHFVALLSEQQPSDRLLYWSQLFLLVQSNWREAKSLRNPTKKVNPNPLNIQHSEKHLNLWHICHQTAANLIKLKSLRPNPVTPKMGLLARSIQSFRTGIRGSLGDLDMRWGREIFSSLTWSFVHYYGFLYENLYETMFLKLHHIQISNMKRNTRFWRSIFYYDTHEVQTSTRSVSEASASDPLLRISNRLVVFFPIYSAVGSGPKGEEFVKKTKDEKASDGWKGTRKEEIHFDAAGFWWELHQIAGILWNDPRRKIDLEYDARKTALERRP